MKKHILFSLAVIFMSVIGCTKPEEGGKDNPQPPAPSQEQITIPSTVDVTPVVPPEGGDAKITFTAASAWTASVISTKADSWVDVNPKSGNPGPAEIKITTTPNDTYVERNATIQIKCGAETKDIVLTQKQLDNITVTTDKVELGVEGGTFTIELKSNIEFSYEINGDWIKYVSTKAYSDKTLTFSAEPNEGVQKREGSVTVKGGEFSETVKVYQSGEEPTLIITQNEYNLEAEGGSITVEVSSNVAVTMTIPESAGWITENQTKSVSTSTFYLDVAANETKEARSVEITFSNEESGLSEKITVNQEGNGSINVPDIVDLGLSVKWASFNLGASKPEEYGGYYQWAGLEDVSGTSIYLDWDNCPYHIGSDPNTGWTKYIPSNMLSYWSGSGSPDNKTVLDPEDDVAHVKLGGMWRMPAETEYQELINNCYSEYTTLNGVSGMKFTSKIAGYTDKWIFLPAAGCLYDSGNDIRFPEDGLYWTSVTIPDYPEYPIYLYLGSDKLGFTGYCRYNGRPVRPVYGDRVSVTGVSLDPSSFSLNIGGTITLNATIIPSNATEKKVYWSSDNTKVAKVGRLDGKVTAVAPGNATITVTTADGTYTATCSVMVKSSEPGVPEAIDLGLSVKWASFNVGASKPEEYGGYYQWAGTQDVTSTTINLGFENCPYHTGSDYSIGWTKYVQSDKSASWSGNGSPDNKTVLDPEDDIAHVTLGNNWRMPTDAEWTELRENCTWTWTDNYNGTGIAGRIVTSNMQGYTDKSIFLPAAGYRDEVSLLSAGINGCYWSSSLESGRPYLAYWTLSYSSNVRRQNCYRFYGNSVRPVYDDDTSATETVDFPDEIFRNYMIKNFDLNNDGEISLDEASKVEVIQIETADIESLSGIEYCTELKSLSCVPPLNSSGNPQVIGLLKTVDVSKNTKLEYLNLSFNRLESLDVSNNVSLRSLYCSENNLSSLDLRKCTKLESLECYGVESINISNTKLDNNCMIRGASKIVAKNCKLMNKLRFQVTTSNCTIDTDIPTAAFVAYSNVNTTIRFGSSKVDNLYISTYQYGSQYDATMTIESDNVSYIELCDCNWEVPHTISFCNNTRDAVPKLEVLYLDDIPFEVRLSKKNNDDVDIRLSGNSPRVVYIGQSKLIDFGPYVPVSRGYLWAYVKFVPIFVNTQTRSIIGPQVFITNAKETSWTPQRDGYEWYPVSGVDFDFPE